MKPLVIIECPYAQDPLAMIAYLRECIRDSLARGESPINSVATFVLTNALDDKDADERRDGIAAGLEWYRFAQKCVCYVDHGISKGMEEGVVRATQHGAPIEYRELNHGKEE